MKLVVAKLNADTGATLGLYIDTSDSEGSVSVSQRGVLCTVENSGKPYVTLAMQS